MDLESILDSINRYSRRGNFRYHKTAVLIDNSFRNNTVESYFYHSYHHKGSLYCMEFMHLGQEVKGLKLSILLPAVV